VLVAWLFLGGVGLAADVQVDPSVLDNGPYDRIISLYGAHTENLLALGAASGWLASTASPPICPGAEAKEIFSYHDDPERFLAPVRTWC
jgi:iron complex transport system substrate-binding protein